MTLPLVSKRTYGTAINECQAWKQRAVAAEDANSELLAEKEACTHLEQAAGVVDGAQVLVLQKDLAKAREQIARQETALRAFEKDHESLHDDLRRLAEERDSAVRTVERLSREGAWTPAGVAS